MTNRHYRNTVSYAVLSRTLIVACIAVHGLAAYAEDTGMNAQDTGNSPSSSEQPVTFSTSTDTNYLNGGIGSEEASAMRLKAAEFPLRMTLSEGKNGKSITGVNVTITDSKGNAVLQVPDAGPLLYAKLPNGTYKVAADYNGSSITKKVSLSGKKGSNVYLNWKAISEDLPNANMDTATAPASQDISPTIQ